MKIIIDNQIAKMFAQDAAEIGKDPLLSDPDNHIGLEWPSLLEYLGLGSVLAQLPTFDQNQPMFTACVSTLSAHEEKEEVFHVYDRLFAENLTQIKSLREINAPFLLQAIKQQLFSALATYEKTLEENASHTMHDLILYLAWDRMCVCLAHLFNHQSTDPKFIKNLEVLKACLIESYQHLVQQGRTSPGFYRMLEALFYYQMREENLPKHTEAEWAVLSQSFPALKAQQELVDIFYIDNALMPQAKEACYMTLDSHENVHARLALARYMIDKLSAEVPGWGYGLHPQKIIYLN